MSTQLSRCRQFWRKHCRNFSGTAGGKASSHDWFDRFFWTWTFHGCFHLPGQISIIPKPELRGFWGHSLPKPPFKMTSAEVVIICPDLYHYSHQFTTHLNPLCFSMDLKLFQTSCGRHHGSVIHGQGGLWLRRHLTAMILTFASGGWEKKPTYTYLFSKCWRF